MTNIRPSADFSLIAHRYDETRDLPESALGALYGHLEATGHLTPETHILDLG